MIRTIAALAALSTMAATAIAADAGTTAAKQRYVSPGIANVTASAAPRPESTSSDARCRELASGIDAVTHSPDRGQKVVRGMGPDGKPRTNCAPTTNGPIWKPSTSASAAHNEQRRTKNAPSPGELTPGIGVYAFAPPSIVNPVPLIDRPSGPTTNATSAATSSALPYC
ncbi:hypothetical protein ACV22X_10080 [Burkholderia orbicola]